MTIIFLNLEIRQVGGELLPEAPFRAYVKFDTAFDKDGGFAALKLEEDGHQIGTATINWPTAEAHRHPNKGKYWVGVGALDEVNILKMPDLPDWKKANLVCAAMEKARWPYYTYDHGLDAGVARARFSDWRKEHLV